EDRPARDSGRENVQHLDLHQGLRPHFLRGGDRVARYETGDHVPHGPRLRQLRRRRRQRRLDEWRPDSMRRGAAALLLLGVVVCHARKEQSIAPVPVQPQALYAQGREALQSGEDKVAERIAHDGQRRFAAQAQWRELFAILEAESIVRNDISGAIAILERTSVTGTPEAA